MSPIVPTPSEDSLPVISSIRLPKKKWAMLDAIVEHETAKSAATTIKKVFSRNEIVESLLDYAIPLYWAAERKPVPEQHAPKFQGAERRKPGGGRKPGGTRKPE